MENETNVTEVVENENLNYIETIKQLKQNTVPKTELEKLQAENKKLLSTLLEGGELEAAATAPQKRSSDEIRKELFSDNADNMSNLELAQKAIELREAILDEGGIDPFVPQGHKILAEDSDFASAEKVAEALKSCIEYADGDSEVFTNELMRITADISPVSTRVKGNRKR